MIDIFRYLMAMLVAAIAAVVGFTNATWSVYGQPDTTTTTVTYPTPATVIIPALPEHTATTVPRQIRCAEHWDSAIRAGWTTERATILLNSIVWAESRCLPDATNGKDHGLAQINYPTWGEQIENELGLRKDHLYDPTLNLIVALHVATEAESYGWRWCQPWDASGDHC